jgi:hypothetical protein
MCEAAYIGSTRGDPPPQRRKARQHVSDDSIIGSLENIGGDVVDIGSNALGAAGNFAEGTYHMVASGADQMMNWRDDADRQADLSDQNKDAFNQDVQNIGDDIGI